ncbi:MAG: hypothetical protein JXB30_20070, partial [Anaerolineae bacterium]|nr:hypothetical protein [Anaerolineae bacterium]
FSALSAFSAVKQLSQGALSVHWFKPGTAVQTPFIYVGWVAQTQSFAHVTFLPHSPISQSMVCMIKA